MQTETILLVALAAPLLLFTLLKVNSSLVFLSACLGYVLVDLVGPEAVAMAQDFAPNLTKSMLLSGLFLLPVVLTTVFMIQTVHGKTKLFLNLLPAAATSLLITLTLVPILPPNLTDGVLATDAWGKFEGLQTLIVGVSTLVSLFFLWLQRPKANSGKHNKHH